MNQHNTPILSVAMPTYNRAELVDFFIKNHIDVFEKFNIELVISDNASDDNTKNVVNKWQKTTKVIRYCRLHKTVSADLNTESALKMSKTEYTWLTGDTYLLDEKLVKHIVFMLSSEKEASLYVINLENMVTNKLPCTYDSNNKLISDLGGLMTCISCLIFKKSVIEFGNFERFRGFYYSHLGVVLEQFSSNNFLVRWVESRSVLSLKHPEYKKNNWAMGTEALEIGFRNWVNFVFSLPPCYLLKSKISCIKSFGKLSKLATLRGFLLMRLRGQLTNDSYKEYKLEINLVSGVPRIVIRLISIFPKWPIKIACIVVAKALNKNGLCR
jgi:abequosyltransferase